MKHVFTFRNNLFFPDWFVKKKMGCAVGRSGGLFFLLGGLSSLRLSRFQRENRKKKGRIEEGKNKILGPLVFHLVEK